MISGSFQCQTSTPRFAEQRIEIVGIKGRLLVVLSRLHLRSQALRDRLESEEQPFAVPAPAELVLRRQGVALGGIVAGRHLSRPPPPGSRPRSRRPRVPGPHRGPRPRKRAESLPRPFQVGVASTRNGVESGLRRGLLCEIADERAVSVTLGRRNDIGEDRGLFSRKCEIGDELHHDLVPGSKVADQEGGTEFLVLLLPFRLLVFPSAALSSAGSSFFSSSFFFSS